MKLGYVTIFDAMDVKNWSGTDLHMWKALQAQGIEVQLVDKLSHGRSITRKLRKLWGRYVEGRSSLHIWDAETARGYAEDVAARIAGMNVDAILSPSPVPLAFLKCPQPKFLWTDATFSALSRTHREFSPDELSSFAVASANAIERGIVANCDRLIYASEWGAKHAIEHSGAGAAKVTVIPFGANLEVRHSTADVARMAAERGQQPIRLLFVGVNWEHKGADKAIAVTQHLHDRGVEAELTIVGCLPPAGLDIPPFVKLLGFISKGTEEGRERIFDLYRQSHFLIVPTVAEAYGLVFAEASAFGVPSLSHRVGGVPTIVRDDVNGRLFDIDQPVSGWADWVVQTFHNNRLADLAASSFREYEARLNWDVAGAAVAAILRDRVKMGRAA